jgi:hypothetical protein
MVAISIRPPSSSGKPIRPGMLSRWFSRPAARTRREIGVNVAVPDLPLEAVHVGVERELGPLHRQADVRAVRWKVDGSDHELERFARMVNEREALVAVDGHCRGFRTAARQAGRERHDQHAAQQSPAWSTS